MRVKPPVEAAGVTENQSVASADAEGRADESRRLVRSVRRATRRQHTPEEKTRMALKRFRREMRVNDLCRREGIKPASCHSWTKEFV